MTGRNAAVDLGTQEPSGHHRGEDHRQGLADPGIREAVEYALRVPPLQGL